MARSVAHNLSRFKSGFLYVGVDLGLDSNVAKITDERARLLSTVTFTHDRQGYDYLSLRMEDCVRRHNAAGIAVGMEPTNYFWMLLAAELERRGIDYYLVNAYTVSKHREGDQIDRTKDDPRDATSIAELLRTGKYTETRLLHGRYAELRSYVVLYSRFQSDIGRQKTLLRMTVGQLFPELGRVFEDLTGITASAMLRNHAAAAVVRRMTEDDFVAAVRADFTGRRLMVPKLRQAHQLAAVSVGLVDGIEARQLAIRLHLEALQSLEAQAAQAYTALMQTFQSTEEAPYLLSLHGLGGVTSATILAEIGDPTRYRNSAQLIKLAGTQPVKKSSGRTTSSLTPMSGQGRPRLRSALYYACLRLIQVDPSFAYDYKRLQERARNPLTKMQAIGVLMNRLLRIIWTLIRYHVYYHPALPRTA